MREAFNQQIEKALNRYKLQVTIIQYEIISALKGFVLTAK